MSGQITLSGGCHCRAVRFELDVASDAVVQECNCSICLMTGYLHLIVPGDRFRLLSDENNLSCYQFNTARAKHLFCRHCGIKSFYVPRSNPDGFSVNVRCLDANESASFQIEQFDGQNWEQHADQLRHLTGD